MDNAIASLRAYRKLILIVLASALALLLGTTIVNNQINKVASEDVLVKKLNRTDFTITKTLVDDKGWRLVRIISTRSEDKGNTAYAVLHNEEGQTVLKAGPGTYFSSRVLTDSGVPGDIQKKIFKELGQK